MRWGVALGLGVAGAAAAGLLFTVPQTAAPAESVAASPPPAPSARAAEVRRGWSVTSNSIDLSTKTPLEELAAGALTGEAVEAAGLAEVFAYDPSAAKFFRYVVECALAEDAVVLVNVGGEQVRFHGSGGLAPEWADGPCEESCQEWVSACMLARTNVYGVTVQLLLVGPHPALGEVKPDDVDGDAVEEGAFFGNIFKDPLHSYACRGAGYDPLSAVVRVCTHPGNACAISVVGGCGDFDGLTGTPVAQPVCERAEGSTYYTSCHNRLDRSGDPDKPDRVWTRVVTTYAQPSGLMEGLNAPCSGLPEVMELEEGPPGGPGEPCYTDDGCVGECLICENRTGQGMCTAACNDQPDPDLEAAECGDPDSTCLSTGGPTGRCTRACTPFEEDACAPGQACTPFALLRDKPDAPGCSPYCTEDAHCPLGHFCNRRFGSCGPREPTEGLLDGDPCIMAEVGNAAPEIPCRGGCFRVVPEEPTKGICGSLVHLAVQSACHDDPSVIKPIPLGVQDEVGVCLYRACKADADCTEPLTCQMLAIGINRCLWP